MADGVSTSVMGTGTVTLDAGTSVALSKVSTSGQIIVTANNGDITDVLSSEDANLVALHEGLGF